MPYEVMGFVVKRENKYRYMWREYLLFNPLLGYAFLSEYDGHWNVIWPIEENPRSSTVDDDFHYTHEGQQHYFKLFQKYRSEVVYAQGELFFDVVDINGLYNKQRVYCTSIHAGVGEERRLVHVVRWRIYDTC